MAKIRDKSPLFVPVVDCISVCGRAWGTVRAVVFERLITHP